ncbi:MAG: protein TolR [Proteobacteria bacterium]|nr:protein TolR [Pseudomonadota bacterium]MCH8173416.1 protein TolR [Pseudomonadota bacterium]
MTIATGGHSSRRKYQPMSEINITPMVDVMLVLLIVFMVTAPLLTQGVAVDLPESAARTLPSDIKPIEITINQNGAIFIGDTEISDRELIVRLKAITATRRDARIYVRGDKANSYGRIMEVIGAINSAGFRKVALVTERP